VTDRGGALNAFGRLDDLDWGRRGSGLPRSHAVSTNLTLDPIKIGIQAKERLSERLFLSGPSPSECSHPVYDNLLGFTKIVLGLD
jgi:hypothetical protein